jgi:hypothetical protein
LLVHFLHCRILTFLVIHFSFCHSRPRFVPLSSGSRLVKTLAVIARLVWGGSSATFLLSVPGIALLAEDAPSTLPVVTIVETISSVLVPPTGIGRGGLEVLHFDGQRLQLLERGQGAQALEGSAYTLWLD